MDMRNGLFAIKLYELEKSYAHLQSRIEICQTANHAKIQSEIGKLKDECFENDLLLQKAARVSRTPMASRLAEAQLAYSREAQRILDEALNQTPDSEEQMDASALYAEYAIDQATQAMNHALLAVLTALEKQHICDDTQEVPT